MRHSSLGRISTVLSTLILVLASGIGGIAFLLPFFVPHTTGGMGASSHAQDAALVFFLLVVLALAAILVDLMSGRMNGVKVAVLGVLAATAAALRIIPGPGGFSALFLIPILGGYVYGPSFGFLLGVFSLTVSAFITAGVGPWMPYQMFVTGWVGALAGMWGRLFAGRSLRPGRWEVVGLAVWGGILGLFYGAVMNLWFWPFVFQPQQPDMYWQSGLGWRETIARYAVFYVTTSLWWDLGRGVGNAVLILAVGRPVVRALRRFQSRMSVEILGQ